MKLLDFGLVFGGFLVGFGLRGIVMQRRMEIVKLKEVLGDEL